MNRSKTARAWRRFMQGVWNHKGSYPYEDFIQSLVKQGAIRCWVCDTYDHPKRHVCVSVDNKHQHEV